MIGLLTFKSRDFRCTCQTQTWQQPILNQGQILVCQAAYLMHAWLPATIEQLNCLVWSMAPTSIFQKCFWMCCRVPGYPAWILLVFAFRKATTSIEFCTFKPSGLICSLYTTRLKNAPAPSNSPFLWPTAKKFHIIWQPFLNEAKVVWKGYLATKCQALLDLNYPL